jgi:hypothetical protein
LLKIWKTIQDWEKIQLWLSCLGTQRKATYNVKTQNWSYKDDGITLEQWIWNYEENLSNWCSRKSK